MIPLAALQGQPAQRCWQLHHSFAWLPCTAPQDEVGELKRRLAVTAHQADQLKGEVAARDGELQREKYDKAKVGGWVE